MPRDYTVWAKGQDFCTKTVYEPAYAHKHDYAAWFTGLTCQQMEEQADFDRQRQAGYEKLAQAALDLQTHSLEKRAA